MPGRNIVGDWPINSLGNKVFDLSGNGNTGTFVNSPTWTGGKFGPAIEFVTASSQYIEINDSDTVAFGDGAGSITKKSIILWYKPNAINVDNFLMGKDTFEYVLSVSAGNRLAFTLYGQTGSLTCQTTVGFMNNAGQWTQLAITYDGGITGAALTLYMNDQSIGSGSGTFNYPKRTTQSLRFAETRFSGYLDGQISHVNFYDKNLSASEIGEIFRESFHRYPENRIFAVA